MKKVLLGSLAALFSVALLFSACSEDDNEKCVTCTEDGKEYEVCWEKGKALDYTSEMYDFLMDHPNAVCDEVTTY